MIEYATYSQDCLGDEHEYCRLDVCECDCHADVEMVDEYGNYDRSWGY